MKSSGVKDYQKPCEIDNMSAETLTDHQGGQAGHLP